MSSFIDLTPAQRPTVAAVGEFAYKDALRRAPSGEIMLEVVPEPDNPHDSRAISVRFRGDVIGYVPRDRTSTYWPVVARVAASGKTARVKGKIYANKATDHYEVSLYLLSGDKAIAGVSGLVPKSANYDVPKAYGIVPGSSGITFTQEEIDAEMTRRRGSISESGAPKKSDQGSNLGCGLVALIALILIVIIF